MRENGRPNPEDISFTAPKTERPKRHDWSAKLMREVSRGPVENFLSKRIDREHIRFSQVQRYLRDKIVYRDRLAGKVEKGLNIVCIGAGKGHEIDEIDSLLPGSNIIGVDPHDHHTRPVKKRLETLAHNSSYLEENVSAENLEGIDDASQDALTFFFVLHHISEDKHKAVLAEAKRVLKEGGLLFVAEDLVNDEQEKKKTEHKDRLLNLEVVKKSPHVYKSKDEWIEFFESQGFSVKEVQEDRQKKVRHGLFVLEKRKIEQDLPLE